MVIKSYKDVSPTRYEGLSDGVQVREMITAQDGAPTFAMRVFDVGPGGATPFHTHTWEHEVYIISGSGRVRAGGKEMSFKAGDSIYIPANEQHCFMADLSAAVQMICCIPSREQCRL
jgi:quercetin dioxygenase-like cupin family protein